MASQEAATKAEKVGTRRALLVAPPGSCDCHIHVFGPAARYRLAANIDYRPEPAQVSDYLDVQRRMGTSRVIVVQPSVYGTDNSCTLDALASLGADARGVAVVDPTISDRDLAALHLAGMRGLRFSLVVKNALAPSLLGRMAARIKPLGWHIQVRSTYKDLPQLEDQLKGLPVDICIDHMSSIPPAEGVDHPAFRALLRLVDGGRCWVKLSAPYQLSTKGAPRYDDFLPQAQALVKAAPERMVWGTNWPHPLAAEGPDEADLLDVLLDWAPDEATRQKILVDNPAVLYGFGDG